jgi:hypothetical protein
MPSGNRRKGRRGGKSRRRKFFTYPLSPEEAKEEVAEEAKGRATGVRNPLLNINGIKQQF